MEPPSFAGSLVWTTRQRGFFSESPLRSRGSARGSEREFPGRSVIWPRAANGATAMAMAAIRCAAMGLPISRSLGYVPLAAENRYKRPMDIPAQWRALPVRDCQLKEHDLESD